MSTRFPAVEYSARFTINRHRQQFLKRLLDVALSLILLIFLSPVMAIIALGVRLDSPGPAIFRQKRIGRRKTSSPAGGEASEEGSDSPTGYTFTFYKFRSMQSNSSDTSHRKFVAKYINGETIAPDSGDSPVYKLTKDKRVTRVGRLLRATSLDELPQLFNVLKGDMSMVGPRPPIPYEVAMYKPRHWRRLEVPPGITGLWQVRGRSKVTFDDMVKMDMEYIDNWSLWLDLKILLLTLPAVLRRDGAA